MWGKYKEEIYIVRSQVYLYVYFSVVCYTTTDLQYGLLPKQCKEKLRC